MSNKTPEWWIYQGKRQHAHSTIRKKLPAPPSWRKFSKEDQSSRGERFKLDDDEAIELVNTALYLRRPLLVTGKPGTGKTSLAYSIAYELGLGEVLRWSITTRSTLQEGLYRYDSIARLQDASLQKDDPDISKYLRLGPLGTAFTGREKQPYVLLIDEIDKSDIDLPNDLLHIFEEGEFEIPELSRLPEEERYNIIDILPHGDGEKVPIKRGRVPCEEFPLVIMTSNGERQFPPAFMRRCLHLELKQPEAEQLADIVTAHLDKADKEQVEALITKFLDRRDGKKQDLATDQLLNAVYLAMHNLDPSRREKHELGERLLNALFKPLSGR
ncbi:MAG: MoxR family ATPase [bacterium]|nr:MoxR family ATPase [bacterium]